MAVLPSLTIPPTLPDITCNSVTMVWAKWTEGRDEGTPPISHYVPYYKMHVTMEWIRGDEVDNSNEDEKYNITFSSLNEDVSYDFSVVPVREGYGGEGHLTNVVQGNTTSCFGATNNSYEENIHGPENVSKNDEQRNEDDYDGALYANLEKPVSIMIADFEKYMSEKDDHSRVVLEMIDGDPHSDYYNANYITNVQSEVAFIASQGPNKASVDDFWRMVWKENVCNIVMLTNLMEDGKGRCIQYWPPTVGTTKRFGKIIVKLESDEQFGDYNIRKLQVDLGENIRTVTNWHFKTWPDKDIPDQPSPLIEFARRIKTYQKTSPGYLLVHCSAGVGRTGTFIALYTLMDFIETDTKIDIYGYVERMRQDRIKMVQTEIQYDFLHECLLEIILTGNTKIPVKNMESFDVQAEKENLKRQFKSYRKKAAFIATQSPLPNTVEDFWRLVYDFKCPVIVMLNQVDPRDKTCCKYWPENAPSRFGNMSVMLKDEQNVGIYMQRQFELTDGFHQEPRLVHHMQLNSWDESNQQDLTILIRDMKNIQQDYSMVEPTVVHCMRITIFVIDY
ncbi:Receptor-type tyrosine-protein phosphatase alpha [Holothuria leucospilota]|uniref:Receptor-type tyrosine-protein phosphatase alpha n=1 Tax=Holothuria leucospilota TaxID=206669 RepID=A0A9Q1BYN9_HOLLE|nr:Receptor-type tyrosine-protein phosphatase alpha [Holothuria leucospilota]